MILPRTAARGTTAFPTRFQPFPPAGGGAGGFHPLTIASREDDMNESTSLDDASVSYTKIQCMGMCLCTTPSELTSIEEMSDDGYYAGWEQVKEDVNGRLRMLEQAMRTASTAISKNTSPDTLKVFVVPEFYFRGNKGAYCTDGQSSLSFYETYLKNALERIITSKDSSGKPRFPHWLVVLGSLLTSGSQVEPAEPTQSLYHTGDNLLNVYYKLYPKPKADGANGESLLRSMLRHLDGKDEEAPRDMAKEDLAFADVLKHTLDDCDRLAGITVTNDCYIVGYDGTKLRTLRVLKEFKSKEDFVLNSKGKDGKANGYLQTITRYEALPSDRNEVKTSDLDDYSIFRFGNVWIGVDICLDHSRQRLFKHLQNHTNNYVDLQIIPSCGMSVRPNAVIARTGCHVFNCDGEYTLKDGSKNGICSHTTLREVSTAINPTAENPSATLEPPKDCSVIAMKGTTALYRFAGYHLHIYEPVQVRPFKP